MNRLVQFAKRIRNFPNKPLFARVESYRLRWNRYLPGVPPPIPIHLRSGLWWTLDMDFVDTQLLHGGYESAELSFITGFVKPGMTVLDIGAHRGFHTIALSKRVGRRGRVFAFEPSQRNVLRLKLHRAMNFCWTVKIKNCALGERNGREIFYEVPANSVLNSLRPPDTELASVQVTARVRTLDDVLSEAKVGHVDFIKLDVEGGELAVLKGAQRLLERTPRPVILCEVLDLRTRPWGYRARLILQHLMERDFAWHELNADGKLSPLKTDCTEFDGNFVAVPTESLQVTASRRTEPLHQNSLERGKETE